MTLLFFLKPHYRPRVGAYIIKPRRRGKKKKVYVVSGEENEAIAEPVAVSFESLKRERERDIRRRRKKIERLLIFKLRTEGLI